MSYKQIKKTKKQTTYHLVSVDLIAENRFTDIINILNGKSDFTNRDRYFYGYSLLHTQQKLKSLLVWWPLVTAKGFSKLQEDCRLIAAHIFSDESFLSSTQLSNDALSTLFFAARSLFPQSQVYRTLQQRFFNVLWEKNDYEKLERTLKSSKERFSGILVENLSKLAFFQPANKLIANAYGFIGFVLTGGAALIARNSIYHNDIAHGVSLLANEIKLLFSQLKPKNKQKITLDKAVFANFVDYEASLLIQVLQLALNDSELNLELIPTPSYLLAYDVATQEINQKFLSWLASKNPELFEMYDANIHHAIRYALGGENLSNINNILKPLHKNKLHPYLRLAIMFRTVNIKKSIFKELVQISEFKNLKGPSLFNKVAINTIKSMTHPEAKTKLPVEFWQMLFEFYPVLQEPEFKNMLIANSIYVLHKKYDYGLSLNLETVKGVAQQTNAVELENDIDVLRARQKTCLQFLLNLEGKSQKDIKNLNSEHVLRAHLTLLADCCILAYPDLSTELFLHIKSLVKNKKIKKIINLEEIFDCDFECACEGCREDLYQDEIPSMATKLDLPIVRIPDEQHYLSVQTMSPACMPTTSILSQTNPFKTLNVVPTDSKQIILQQVMALIKQSPEKMAIFRQAQNELFNPAQRFLHEYFRIFVYEDIEAQAHPLPLSTQISLHEIPFRNEFLYAG